MSDPDKLSKILEWLAEKSFESGRHFEAGLPKEDRFSERQVTSVAEKHIRKLVDETRVDELNKFLDAIVENEATRENDKVSDK